MPNDDLDPDVSANVAQPCCIRCARELHSPRSLRLNYGHECWSAILAASRLPEIREDDWTFTQLDNAIDLMREGGIMLWRKSSRNLIYRSVATDGITFYLTTVQTCNCPAGCWERSCYHRLAVTILQLSIETARVRRQLERRKVS